MPKSTFPIGKIKHIFLWSTAILYLLFSPSLYYHLSPLQEGKPLEVWKEQPETTGNIRYHVEECKFWFQNMPSSSERETYALWGWAFLNLGTNTLQTDFDRFVIIYDESHSYVFPVRRVPRSDVQDKFKDLNLIDLQSSGFSSVISRNALAIGEYGIGLLFKHKQDGSSYYTPTNTILVRSPNHLTLKVLSK